MVTDYSPPPLPGAIFSFNLTNSTPSIVIAGETLISSEQKKYNSGTLTVYMNQYPVGTYNSYYSSCRLTLNNGELVYESSYLHKYGCSSSRDSSTGSIGGGISGESSNFAVINFSKPVYSNSSSFIEYTGLIFQK
jgi:hypothetical protein